MMPRCREIPSAYSKSTAYTACLASVARDTRARLAEKRTSFGFIHVLIQSVLGLLPMLNLFPRTKLLGL